LRLILKYPTAFLQSHLRGTLESTFIFRPKALDPSVVKRRGWSDQYLLESSRPQPPIWRRSLLRSVLVIAMSTAHFGYLVLGTFGLVLLYPALNLARRAALLVIIFMGVISVLTGGAVYSPRFRIPLDISFVVGIANCISWMRRRAAARRSETALEPVVTTAGRAAE